MMRASEEMFQKEETEGDMMTGMCSGCEKLQHVMAMLNTATDDPSGQLLPRLFKAGASSWDCRRWTSDSFYFGEVSSEFRIRGCFR